MKKLICLLCFGLGCAGALQATVSEPDNVIYGLVYAGTNQITQITAANRDIVIEARRTPNGPALASYAMGSKAALGDYYSLRLNLESVRPVSGVQSFQPGDTAYLTVTGPAGALGQQAVTIGARGQMSRVDFLSGGLPAGWITQLRHPADVAPADNAISFGELDAYTTAWKTGQSWSRGPSPIPIGYAVRAGALWLDGGNYVFDPSQVDLAGSSDAAWWATNSPLWWATSVPSTPPLSGNSVVRAVPAHYEPGVPLAITATVTCNGAVGVHAIEDQPPAGWLVSNISDAGVFDPVTQKVKWGLFFDSTSRVVGYTLTPPTNAVGDVVFSGVGSFDGQLVGTSGANRTGPAEAGPVRLTSVNYALKGFKMKLQGIPGDEVLVQMSTNLQTWVTLTNMTMEPDGTCTFDDLAASNHPQCFYRTQAND